MLVANRDAYEVLAFQCSLSVAVFYQNLIFVEQYVGQLVRSIFLFHAAEEVVGLRRNNFQEWYCAQKFLKAFAFFDEFSASVKIV